MKNREIENKLRSAFDAVSPDKLDSVLACCADTLAENKIKEAPIAVSTKIRWQKRWLSAASLALVAICVSTAFVLNGRRANDHVIGSVESSNTESIAATESYNNTESTPIIDSESTEPDSKVTESAKATVTEPTEVTTVEPTVEPTEDVVVEPTEVTVVDPTVEPTEDVVVEPTEVTVVDPTVEPTEDVVIEPTEITVHEPTEEPTENVVIEPTEVIVPEPTEATRPEVTEDPDVTTDSETSSVNTGEAFCPVPDPEYRELRGAISDALRTLIDEASSTYYPVKHYRRKDAVYVCAWLGESDGEAVYYVTYCIGKHRIDCKIPVIYKNEITDFTITPLVERGPGETGYIGSDSAKILALTAAGVSEGSVDALSVSIDRFKEHPSYHITFYYNGSRYFYDFDAVSGKLLFQNVYDLTALKKFVKEQQEGPYYIEPELISDDLLFDRIKSVIRASETNTTDRSTRGLFVERVTDIVNDDILDIHYKGNNFVCKGEITADDEYFICFEESKIERTTNVSLDLKNLADALKSAGIKYNYDVRELNAELNGETYDIIVKTKETVYKFGIWQGLRPLKSRPGPITYFGKAPVGKEAEMVFVTADSALQKALDYAGVTEYTLVWNDSIKQQFGTGKDLRYAYYYDITFNSGGRSYIYKVDLFTGKEEKYL